MANPGPQEFLPGAQIFKGPENFPLHISSCLTTPPIIEILYLSGYEEGTW